MAPIVPVVDIAPFFSGNQTDKMAVTALVDQTCRNTGFLIITGHGIPPDLINRVRDSAASFFQQPAERKRVHSMRWLDSRGWEGPDRSSLAETMDGTTLSDNAADLRESFGIGPLQRVENLSEREEPFFRDNIWPDWPTDFRMVLEEYYRSMENLSAQLLEIFACALDLQQGYFANKNDRHLSHLVINHYPAQLTTPRENQIRAGAHTDFGDLTILHADPQVGGLQICNRDGVWQDVISPADAFIVNIGDLMALWTNGRWVSTLHRVVNPPPELADRYRQSIVYFHQPNWHAEIRCIPTCISFNSELQEPTTSGAHYEMKLSRIGRDANNKLPATPL